MQTSTTLWRGLCLALVLLGFAGSAYAQRTVALRLNSATIPDTVNTEGFFEVRGSVGGQAPATLPDGNVINWGEDSTLEPTNVGGDYWEVAFQIPEGEPMEFKYWSQDAEGVGLNGGWETNANNWQLPGGTGDTTLLVHYFAPAGQNEYDWRPWAQKADSIAVLFRVYMATESAVAKGFIAGSDDIEVGIRGDGLGGASPLDWGATRVILEREGTDPEQPGFFLYSGAVHYPVSAAGTTQPYKFYIEGVDNGWEDTIGDRSFTIPAADTTLRWVYFNDSPPTDDVPTSDPRTEAFVTFSVDVTTLEAAGLFSPARSDSIQVRGPFNGWADSNIDRSRLRPSLFDPALWQNELSILDTLGAVVPYKFYLDQNLPEGETTVATWEEPLDYGGGNRTFVFTGEDINLGTGYYNNIREGNVIPEGTTVDVTFQVDMEPAQSFSPAFDPAADQVRISFEDGIWEGIQAVNKGIDQDGDDIQYLELTDPDGDLVYTGTFTVVGPTYNGIGYRVQYGGLDGVWTNEVGDQEGAPGRRRYQYVLPNTDGSFASAVTLPLVPAVNVFPLPFECNPTADLASLPESVSSICYEAGTSPTAVEPIDGMLPEQVSLSPNYPNPFNPTTAFEYGLHATEHVTVRVFDAMGRLVATLHDGVQTAGTYRVTFDARGLASGLYLYQVATPSRTLTKTMTLLK